MDVLWTAEEIETLGTAIKDLQDTLQEWEVQHNLKIKDVLLSIETQDRPVRPVGLVSLPDKANTVIQFEPIEADLTIA